MESVDLAAGKNVVTIGNYSDVKVDRSVSGLHKLTLKAGKAPGKDNNEAIWTNFSAAEGIYGTEYNDSVNIGNWCKAAISNIDMLEGKNTFVCGRYSDVAVDGDIINVYKLTVNAGSAEYQTRFAAGAVIGSANNDSVTFGNWSSGEIDSITFADGNDQLKIGDNARLTVDFLDFGNGSKDTMTLGKNAVLTLTDEITAWVDLNVLNAGKGSEIWTRTQIDFEDTTGSFQNATLYHECSFDFDENAAGLLVDELYSNEYDIWSFTADKSGSMSFEVINGEDILVECRNAAGEWMDYSSMWSMGVVAGESYEIRVSCEGDYKDKYEKKEYAITATIA